MLTTVGLRHQASKFLNEGCGAGKEMWEGGGLESTWLFDTKHKLKLK